MCVHFWTQKSAKLYKKVHKTGQKSSHNQATQGVASCVASLATAVYDRGEKKRTP
jgi:hypothetical protein